VLQHLKAWSAAPPKLRETAPTPSDAEPLSPSLTSTSYSSQDGAEQVPPAVEKVPNDQPALRLDAGS
jgi:hypothetical protein